MSQYQQSAEVVIGESFDTGQLELGMGMASPQVHSWYDSPKHSSIFLIEKQYSLSHYLITNADSIMLKMKTKKLTF